MISTPNKLSINHRTVPLRFAKSMLADLTDTLAVMSLTGDIAPVVLMRHTRPVFISQADT